MSAKKTVPLIVCISLILSSCSVAISPMVSSIAENYNPPRESRENENILEANKESGDVGSNTTLHCKRKDLNRCLPTRIPGQTEIDIAEWEE